MITKSEVLLKLRHKVLTNSDIEEYSKNFKFEHDYLCRPHVLTERVYEDQIFTTGLVTTLIFRNKN